jgi:hypothetical protein
MIFILFQTFDGDWGGGVLAYLACRKKSWVPSLGLETVNKQNKQAKPPAKHWV